MEDVNILNDIQRYIDDYGTIYLFKKFDIDITKFKPRFIWHSEESLNIISNNKQLKYYYKKHELEMSDIRPEKFDLYITFTNGILVYLKEV